MIRIIFVQDTVIGHYYEFLHFNINKTVRDFCNVRSFPSKSLESDFSRKISTMDLNLSSRSIGCEEKVFNCTVTNVVLGFVIVVGIVVYPSFLPKIHW